MGVQSVRLRDYNSLHRLFNLEKTLEVKTPEMSDIELEPDHGSLLGTGCNWGYLQNVGTTPLGIVSSHLDCGERHAFRKCQTVQREYTRLHKQYSSYTKDPPSQQAVLQSSPQASEGKQLLHSTRPAAERPRFVCSW